MTARVYVNLPEGILNILSYFLGFKFQVVHFGAQSSMANQSRGDGPRPVTHGTAVENSRFRGVNVTLPLHGAWWFQEKFQS